MLVEQGGVNEPMAATTIIGADVGGTYARLGWTTLRAGEPIRVNDFRRYACADHPSLAAILRDYAARLHDNPAIPPVSRAVVAIAGLLDGDCLLNTNLAWQVSLAQTRSEAGLGELELINDFVAVAQAIPHVERETLQLLCGDADHRPHGPALVLGPGTGLGVALRLESSRPPVLASEGGHASLAAGHVVKLDKVTTRVATMACAETDRDVFATSRGLIDEVVLVDDDDMLEAARWLWFEMGLAADLSGAAAAAALRKGVLRFSAGEKICALVCGAGPEGLA